ncbi:MAG: dTDP-4-dehydrorhamnose reductase [Beijerinckiaceae bacterium]|nr:dTDP-4-dehydrorhamnose reductase [Beijerinckiaceae bacterium]MCI0736341.1 dTDP-4-dehydrorhamnose reductase [Beijerinckiaceae bacterium]
MNGPVLIFGASGQLGREIFALARTCGVDAIGYDRARADITKIDSVTAAVLAVKPRLVVNAAAYTAVDRAESEPEAANAANVIGAEAVARAAALRQVPVIQLSTDYVFDGTKMGAYVETDRLAPLGVYGATKAEGEARVRDANPRHFILRTSWVYGRYGSNFLKTILRLSRERDELRIVADQRGCPTATADLAEAILAIGRALKRGSEIYGTYHFAGEGATSWHGFASLIVETQARETRRLPKVTPVSTADFPTPARRPANSELDSSHFASTFGFRARPWQMRVREAVHLLMSEARAEA